jgi:hypothetical protein
MVAPELRSFAMGHSKLLPELLPTTAEPSRPEPT